MSSWTPPPGDSPRRLAGLRVSYDVGTLDEADLRDSPLEQFRAWLEDAVQVRLPEPNAMILATADRDGQPSARTVLLKDADPRGFVLFTNLESRKGRELAANPAASLVFPWFAMHRQVVVVGRAELLDRGEVEDYFSSRPRGSQLGAWTSRQSAVIEGRAGLDARYDELVGEYPDGVDVPVPPFWGGWRVRPQSVEFWQGRESRLHDRLRFRRREAVGAADLTVPEHWQVERLSP